MTPTNNPLIAKLREALGKATEGEWWFDGITYIFTKHPKTGDQMIADDHVEEPAEPVIRMRGAGAQLPIEDNARFITLAHNLMPQLLDEFEKLEREAEAGRKLAEELSKTKTGYDFPALSTYRTACGSEEEKYEL